MPAPPKPSKGKVGKAKQKATAKGKAGDEAPAAE